MAVETVQNQIGRAAGLLRGAKRMVAFTGAGISADSGIPTYRGAGGLWSKYDPEKYANIDYFRRDPTYYWRFFRDVRHPVLDAARPNEAHAALAHLESSGRLDTVITQNIDGLHQEAGSERVLELHGNTRRFLCQQCAAVFGLDVTWERLQAALPPTCPDCGGGLRPDVVLFGEMLPEAVLRQAVEAARSADVILVVGSSLVVQPAAGLPVLTMEHGGRLIIVNVGETPLDRVATIKIDAGAAEVLPQLVGLMGQ
jgi:NAD-dependent protein deacetylase/lipoamidase